MPRLTNHCVDAHYLVDKVTSTESPAEIPSTLRIAAFSGRTKQPDFLSGKMEVLHDDSPIVTSTGIDPNPRWGPLRARSSSLSLGGTVA